MITIRLGSIIYEQRQALRSIFFQQDSAEITIERLKVRSASKPAKRSPETLRLCRPRII